MHKILIAATLTVLTLGFASLASAEGVKKSKSNVGNNRAAAGEPECGTAAAGDECAASEVSSPRDAASGQATGKRQHKPLTIRKEVDKSSPAMAATADADGDGAGDAAAVNHEVVSPRDAASGLPTGKRQTAAGGASGGETPCPPGSVASSEGCVPEGTEYRGSDPFKGTNIARAKQEREAKEKAAQGKAAPTGAGGTIVEPDEHAINTKGTGSSGKTAPPRDAASGQATGKRQHTPVRVSTGDVNGDGTADAAAAQDHNSSRSNKTASVSAGDGSGDGAPDPQGMAINEKGLPGDKKVKTTTAK